MYYFSSLFNIYLILLIFFFFIFVLLFYFTLTSPYLFSFLFTFIFYIYIFHIIVKCYLFYFFPSFLFFLIRILHYLKILLVFYLLSLSLLFIHTFSILKNPIYCTFLLRGRQEPGLLWVGSDVPARRDRPRCPRTLPLCHQTWKNPRSRTTSPKGALGRGHAHAGTGTRKDRDTRGRSRRWWLSQGTHGTRHPVSSHGHAAPARTGQGCISPGLPLRQRQ